MAQRWRKLCSGQRLDGTAFTVQTYEVTDAATTTGSALPLREIYWSPGQQGLCVGHRRRYAAGSPYGHEHRRGELRRFGHRGQRLAGLLQRGLIRYSPGCFASPNLAAGLTDMDINAVTAAGGRYYAAVNQGLLAFDSGWQPVSIS